MAEIGIDISEGYTKPWTHEVLEAADVVVTMGCGDACPLYPGEEVRGLGGGDPADRSLDEVFCVRDQIGLRVLDLLPEIGIVPDLSGLENWVPRGTVAS